MCVAVPWVGVDDEDLLGLLVIPALLMLVQCSFLSWAVRIEVPDAFARARLPAMWLGGGRPRWFCSTTVLGTVPAAGVSAPLGCSGSR